MDGVSLRTAAKAPVLLDIEPKLDDRGYLVQVFGSPSVPFPPLKRVYMVGNFSKGVIRGLHLHRKEWKAYFVAGGAAKFVIEQNGESPMVFVLSDKKPAVLVVPPGFYHGWVSLASHTFLMGLSSATLAESQLDDERKDPLSLGREVWKVRPR